MPHVPHEISHPVLLSRNRLHGADEVAGINGVEGIAMQEMAENLEERFVADQVPRHGQHQGALGISVAVKHVLWQIIPIESRRSDSICVNLFDLRCMIFTN
jgi:hypothetical protein